MPPTTRNPKYWYKDFFTGVALDFWDGVLPDEHTDEEIQLIESQLRCQPKESLLDIPCGSGRHCLPLARQGYRMTGVDVSSEYLKRAKSRMGSLKIDLVNCDMVDFERRDAFDGAYCLGNSFAYLEPERLQLFLGNVLRSLKRGGRFLVDASMAAECLFQDYKEKDWYETADLIMLIRHSFDTAAGVLETEYTFIKDGKIEKRTSLHLVRTACEMRDWFEQAGFEVVAMLGSPDEEIFHLGSPQLFIVAERPS